MNKYKNLNNNLNIKNGEVALTYGVQYLDDNEKKSKIKPARPYLVIKKVNNKYHSLKLTSKDNKYLDDFKIEVSKYPYNHSLVKDSYVETSRVYELEIGDFIQNGVVLTKRDLICIYNKLMKSYIVEGIKINDEVVRFVYKEYISHKRIEPGTMVKTMFFNGQLLILEENDNCYKCLLVYRDGEQEYDESFQFYRYNNYVNYSEIYYLPKTEMVYISNFGINSSLFRYIKSRVDERKQEKSLLILKKDL